MKKKITTSVVIPFYTKEPINLKNIFNQKTKHNYEIIICDDASPTKPKIPKKKSKSLQSYKTITNPTNTGPGGARNLAKKTAKGKYILFIDSDVTIDEYFVEEMTNAIKITNKKTAALEAHQSFPTNGNFIQKMIWFIPDMTGNTRRENVDWASTTASIWKKKTLDKLNWFKQWRTGEDTDLSERAKKAGYKFNMAQTWILQDYRPNLKSFLKQQFHYGQGGARLIKEKGQLPNKRKNYIKEYLTTANHAKKYLGNKGYIYILILQPLKHTANLAGLIHGKLTQ